MLMFGHAIKVGRGKGEPEEQTPQPKSDMWINSSGQVLNQTQINVGQRRAEHTMTRRGNTVKMRHR